MMFIQAQDLPWQKGLHGPGREDIELKTLSIDENGTEATTIIRYPAGWQRTSAEYNTAHEEFLVLDGEITLNGQTFDRHCYGFFPAGYTRESAASPTGAVLLTMFYDRPMIINGTGKAYDDKLLVKHIDAKAMEWDTSAADPQFPKGVGIKQLRINPYNGEMAFLYSAPPHRAPAGMMQPQWTHPTPEEIFMLDGECVWGDVGRMGPGAYAWWREGVFHGPAGTDTGYHMFVRTIGGPLANEFATEAKPLTWDAPYNPQLPEDVKKLAKGYAKLKSY
jgi:hypothetical protein